MLFLLLPLVLLLTDLDYIVHIPLTFTENLYGVGIALYFYLIFLVTLSLHFTLSFSVQTRDGLDG